LTFILPSRASQPTAIETIGFGALTPLSKAVRLHSPLERMKFHTWPAVSPIVSISHTTGTSSLFYFGILILTLKYLCKIFTKSPALASDQLPAQTGGQIAIRRVQVPVRKAHDNP
jgi:hypothetical protein